MRDVISLGMVGVGGWGRFVVRNFNQNPNCNLKYICDANEDLLARQAPLYPSATLTTDFQTVLDDDEVDAVAIVTPAIKAPISAESPRALAASAIPRHQPIAKRKIYS